MVSRRDFVARSAMAGGALLAARSTLAEAQSQTAAGTAQAVGEATPVVTPNGISLPYRIVEGVKVFHLTAEPVEHEFAPGLTGACWGYNARTTGPTIEGIEGDRVRIYVTNRLPESTTVHWHGIILPN